MSRGKESDMASNKGDVEVRPMELEDERALLDFYARHQPTWNLLRHYWGWRRDGLPHSGGEEASIALENGDVVGAVGIVPADLTFGGLRIKASWQQDSLVSSQMRGRGVGKKLVRAGWEGWDLSISKGTSKGMYGLRKALGYLDAPNSDYLVRVHRTRAGQSGLSKRLKERLLWAWKTLLPQPNVDRGIPIREVKEFDETFDSLAESLDQEDVLRLHKSQGYLNWRYGQCPGREYTLYRAGGDQARGAVVVATAGERRDEGWIVDLVGCATDEPAAIALLSRAIQRLEEEGVARTYVFATYPPIRAWLKRFGFLPTGLSPKFTYRIIRKEGLPDMPDLASACWDFWHGDGDVELYM